MPGMKEFMDRLKAEGSALGEAVLDPQQDRSKLNQKHGLGLGQNPSLPPEPMEVKPKPSANSMAQGAMDPAMRAQIMKQLEAARMASQAAGEAEALKLQQAEQQDQQQYSHFPKLKKQFGGQ